MKRRRTARPGAVLSYRKGYHDGRVDGFRKGKEAGFQAGLENARKEAKPTVLIISSPHLPSYRIGIEQPLRWLQQQGACRYSVKHRREVGEKDIAQACIVIVQRSVEPLVYHFFRLAKSLGKRTVYVIDDHFAALPATGRKGKYYHDPVRLAVYEKFLREADVVKVDSAYFGEHLRKQYSSTVVYFPASVDFSWIQRHKPRVRKDEQTVVIGYAGTKKEEDFVPVVSALEKLWNEFGSGIRLVFFGFVPERLQRHPAVTHEPPERDYKTFLRKLCQSRWDIGLAPLKDTLFNRCKTNNKFREYAACGIPGIYSDLPAYSDWVVNGRTGLLVPHTKTGWYKGLRELITDADLRERIKTEAEALAKTHFTIQACASQWRKRILQLDD